VRAAIVHELGAPPEVGDVPEPKPSEGRSAVEVVAAGLNPLDIAVGAGRYFAGHPDPPYVPGAEAVARLPDGSLAYVYGDGLGVARDGTFAERVLAAAEQAFPVVDRLEPALAVSLGIAGLAGWGPLAWRAPVRPDDIVLVLGATGTVGLVAVQAARILGAARVVAAGRDQDALRRAQELGADATVRLDGGDTVEAIREACGGDGPTLVHDPLWGEPGAAAVEAAARGARIVNLGQSAGPDASLRSGAIRGKQLELYGYTNFALPREVLADLYRGLCEHAARGDIQVDVETVPLDQIADAWQRQSESPHVKLVVVPGR
jgi:NADPH2:quinone reductase